MSADETAPFVSRTRSGSQSKYPIPKSGSITDTGHVEANPLLSATVANKRRIWIKVTKTTITLVLSIASVFYSEYLFFESLHTRKIVACEDPPSQSWNMTNCLRSNLIECYPTFTYKNDEWTPHQFILLAAFAAMVAVLIGLIVYADFIQAKLLRVLTYRFYVIKESRWPQAVAAILLLIAVGGYVILKYDMLVRTDDEDDTVMCNGAFYYIRLAGGVNTSSIMSAVGSFLFFLWAFHGIVLDIWTDITDPYSRITISDLMIPGYGNPGDHLKEIRLVDYDTLKEVEAEHAKRKNICACCVSAGSESDHRFHKMMNQLSLRRDLVTDISDYRTL